MRWLRILLIVLLAGTLCATAEPAAGHTPLPLFAVATCPFKIGTGLIQGRDVRCGFLTVLENHQAPGGRTIQLAVAIFTGAGREAHPDPVISLQGGPGGPWVGELGPAITKQVQGVLAGGRDLVLMDQRGVGLSKPSLACPELVALKYRTLEQNLPAAKSLSLLSVALSACRARLVHQGIDLGTYTTAQDAADVHDLQTALGYGKVNLYGVSYGTALVLATMRAYPAGIRSAVLDSVLPVQENDQISGTINVAHGLHSLFAACAASPPCNAAFPKLEVEFAGFVARLNAKPVTITVTNAATGKIYRVPLTGDDLVNVVVQSLYVTPFISQMPAVIDAAQRGYFKALASIYSQLSFDDTLSDGMYNSVECGEDATHLTLNDFRRAAAGYAPSIRQGLIDQGQQFLTTCAIWHVPAVDPAFKTPVRSAIPTLLLAGQFDPVTPLSEARLAATTLSKHFIAFFPGDGHGQQFSGQCPAGVVLAFYDDPLAKPDTSCTAAMDTTFNLQKPR